METAQQILKEIEREQENLKNHQQEREVVLSFDMIKSLKNVGELVKRVGEVKEYNKVKQEQEQTDKNLTKCLKELAR